MIRRGQGMLTTRLQSLNLDLDCETRFHRTWFKSCNVYRGANCERDLEFETDNNKFLENWLT